MSTTPQFLACKIPVFDQKREGPGPSFEGARLDAARALPDALFGDEAQPVPRGSLEVSEVVAACHAQWVANRTQVAMTR